MRKEFFVLEYLALVARALRFWTRIDLPVLSFEIDPHAPPVMNELAPAVPLAGALIGLAGALVLALGAGLGLPALVTAVLALALMAAVTGAMHEDGLADIADAFGARVSIERKLEIMKDPRLGSFGVVALGLALLLRAAVLADLLAGQGWWRAGLLLVGAAAFARILGLWPLHALSAARLDGAGVSTGGLAFEPWRRGALIGALLALACGLIGVGLAATLAAFLAAAAVTWAVTRLADRQIGGYTGDVCGATTIIAETAFLTAALIHIW